MWNVLLIKKIREKWFKWLFILYKKCVPQFEKKTQTLLAWLFIYTSFNLKKGRHWLYTVSYILCCTIHRSYSFKCSYLLFTVSSIYICTFIKKHTQLYYIRNVGSYCMTCKWFYLYTELPRTQHNGQCLYTC